MPFLDFLLDKNPVMRVGPPNLGNITRIALEHIDMRVKGTDPNFDPKHYDYLQHFLDAKAAQPDVVHDGMIMNYLFINLIAGADTTAITIRAVMYMVLKHPEVLLKLNKEVLAADLGKVAQYNAARALPCECCHDQTLHVTCIRALSNRRVWNRPRGCHQRVNAHAPRCRYAS